MTHTIHRPGYEELSLLDPECEDCCEKKLAQLDGDHFQALFGMTRAQFDVLTDPSAAASGTLSVAAHELDAVGRQTTARYVRMAQAILWAGRYALRNELALRLARDVQDLQRTRKWPLDRTANPFSSLEVAGRAGLLSEAAQEPRSGQEGSDASGEAE